MFKDFENAEEAGGTSVGCHNLPQTTFDCQSCSGRTGLGQDHFSHDSTSSECAVRMQVSRTFHNVSHTRVKSH